MNLSELHELFLSSEGICTDSRNVQPNTLYFALKGSNHNGNHFSQSALDQGCTAVICDEPSEIKDSRFILVENALNTLQNLANFHRKSFQIPVIAITGSNGKTTTRELVHEVLSSSMDVLATQGNLNNHIGVPLTLLKLKKHHQIAVIEMGANHQGEIKMLCEIAEPEFGIITNIGKAHLEGFGGLEGVKKGKSELYKFIGERKGMIFLNGDDETLLSLSSGIKSFTYGISSGLDIIGNALEESDFLELEWEPGKNENKRKDAQFIRTNLVGKYNLANALCAVAVGKFFKISEEQISTAISKYLPENHRSQLKSTERNSLILDCYNANPTSMRFAILNFTKMKAQNKWLILGDMMELGEESLSEHKAIIELLQHCDLNDFVLIGEAFHSLLPEKSFPSVVAASPFIKEMNLVGKMILIKGSRSTKLEELTSLL